MRGEPRERDRRGVCVVVEEPPRWRERWKRERMNENSAQIRHREGRDA
jgi:hypothetical protein